MQCILLVCMSCSSVQRRGDEYDSSFEGDSFVPKRGRSLTGGVAPKGSYIDPLLQPRPSSSSEFTHQPITAWVKSIGKVQIFIFAKNYTKKSLPYWWSSTNSEKFCLNNCWCISKHHSTAHLARRSILQLLHCNEENLHYFPYFSMEELHFWFCRVYDKLKNLLGKGGWFVIYL